MDTNNESSNRREVALLFMVITIIFAMKSNSLEHIKYALMVGIIGILYPAPFHPFVLFLKLIGPKVHALGSYLLLNIIFAIAVIPVGLVRNFFLKDDSKTIIKEYTKSDFERLY